MKADSAASSRRGKLGFRGSDEALKAAEVRYRTLLERSPDGVLLIDPKTTLPVEFNDAAYRQLGYSREEFAKLRVSDYEVLEAPVDTRARGEKLLRAGRDDFETQHRTKGGEIRHVSVTAQTIEISGLHFFLSIYRDITERKQAERRIASSEAKYRSIFDGAADAIFLADPDTGNIVDANLGAERLLGWPRDEIIGMHQTQLHPPEKVGEYAEKFRSHVAQGQAIDFEAEVIRKDGSVVPVLISASVIDLPEGRILQGRFTDITERKRAEEALQEERDRLEMVTQGMGAGLAIISKDYQTVWANQVLKGIFGDDVAGKTCYVTYNQRPNVCPDCGVREVFETGKSLVVHEQVGKDAAGNTIWSQIMASPIRDREGNIAAALELVVPITERKLAEEALRESNEKFRTLVETINDWVWEVDEKGIYTYASPRVRDVLGYEPGEIIGKTAFDFMTAEEKARVGKLFAEFVSRQQPFTLLENVNLHKDGHPVTLESSGIPLFDRNGVFRGYRGSDRDISGRMKAEKGLRERDEHIRQLQRLEAVGRLAGGVAHEFNNLLTIISGHSELMLERLGKLDPLRKGLEQIYQASDRAAALTRQLLAFSRKQMVEPKVLDLNQVVRNMEGMIRHLTGEDIHIVTALDPALGTVKADPGQIEQVIMNLVANSRDAMPQGGNLTIETENVYLDEGYASRHVAVQPGRYVMLAVSDTGCGMNEETKSHIFEPFFTTKEGEKGTGLGLSTIYGIVKQSGGNVWVYSELGQGTTFKTYLPRVDEPAEHPELITARPTQLQGSESILLVEDEDMVRQLVRSVLEMHGYTVLEAHQGGEALLICEQHQGPIHLMVTDVVMPQMSGPQLAERLAPLRPEMKVLYMSGYTDNAIVHHGILESGIAFIHKPFTSDGLARKVREVLDAPRKA